jgi:hypothetical protein
MTMAGRHRRKFHGDGLHEPTPLVDFQLIGRAEADLRGRNHVSMSIPVRQAIKIGGYLIKQKLAGRAKFALTLELEPLFACNLACGGCGKIQHPAGVLKQRMPVEQALAAVDECGAPVVCLARGEPLMHPEVEDIVAGLVKRRPGP